MHCNCESAYEEHDLVECITSALDARDPYTGNHSRRVSDMACDLCQNMQIRRFILQPTTWALMRQWEVCCLIF